MEKTKFYSWKSGELAKGCELCVKGQKSVFFITGKCSRNCWYCSLSDVKKNVDKIFVNEWPIEKDEDVIKEIELCDSKGCSFTGGDPLLVLEKTLKYTRLLKERFGKNFHIHLYAPTKLVNEENLKKLYEAGIDEIRFHPEFLVNGNKEDWNKILLAKKFDWKIGAEIPVIPGKGKEIKEFIDFLTKNKIDFLNLNELEFSDSNSGKMEGFECKDDLSYKVKGSEELALDLLNSSSGLNIHYCTAKLKDSVQLPNRIKRRARNIKKDYDKVTSEGTLIRGAIYLEKPGFGYRKKLEEISNKDEIISKLEEVRRELMKKFCISSRYLEIDRVKLRLLTSLGVINKLRGKVPYILAKVEEYPTYDEFEVEIEFYE